jgi:hypothetical protein
MTSFILFIVSCHLVNWLHFSFLNNLLLLQAAGQYYFSHPEVKDIVKRIREDPRNYLRFAKAMIYYIKQYNSNIEISKAFKDVRLDKTIHQSLLAP